MTDEAQKTTAKATTKKEKEEFPKEYYEGLGIALGKNGDKRKTDLNGNPLNF